MTAEHPANGPVVFVNILRPDGAPAELERVYAGVADYFRAQPGLLRYQLVRSTHDPGVYVSIAEWQDAESFRRATAREEFRNAVRVGSVAAIDPHLCEVVLRGGPS